MLQISGSRSSGNSITICFFRMSQLLPSLQFLEALLTDVMLIQQIFILQRLPHTAFSNIKIVWHNIVYTTMVAYPLSWGWTFRQCKACLILSKRSLLHNGSLRGPPIPLASGHRQYEDSIENSGLEVCFKTTIKICNRAHENSLPHSVFSFTACQLSIYTFILSVWYAYGLDCHTTATNNFYTIGERALY